MLAHVGSWLDWSTSFTKRMLTSGLGIYMALHHWLYSMHTEEETLTTHLHTPFSHCHVLMT